MARGGVVYTSPHQHGQRWGGLHFPPSTWPEVGWSTLSPINMARGGVVYTFPHQHGQRWGGLDIPPINMARGGVV
ncbi:hypothetical protein ACOMHN_019222 [Nucella lapillus]